MRSFLKRFYDRTMLAQIDPLYIKTRPYKALKRYISYGLFEGRPLTTKGRWINPILFQMFSIMKKLPQIKKVKQPVFIVGTGRSGTTILGIVLSMHKDIGFLNEPKAIWHAVYSHEDIIGSYTQEEANYRLSVEQVNEEIKKGAHHIFGTYLFLTRSKVLVDKYPELIFRTSFVKEIFPDAKFLFLARNVWDTCLSISLWSQRKGIQQKEDVKDWWGLNDRKWKLLVDQLVPSDIELKGHISEIRSFSDHRERAAVEWILTMKEGISLLNKLPESTLLVKFENLTNHPEEELEKIRIFCELREDRTFLRYALRTLSPLPYSEPFEVNPCLITALFNTMKKMGYG
jgi:hypothetical protein